MPKRNSTKLNNPDPNVLAHRSIAAISALSGEPAEEVSSKVLHDVMAAMGRKGGRIGGKRRLDTMTPEERTAAALKAARARWKKAKKA
jgi:hypothetical protein